MLLITRRTNESVIINGCIEVKIIEIKGGRAKLGFEYPEGNSVFRQELFEKIQDENRAAAQQIDPNKLSHWLPTLNKNNEETAPTHKKLAPETDEA